MRGISPVLKEVPISSAASAKEIHADMRLGTARKLEFVEDLDIACGKPFEGGLKSWIN